MTPADAATAAKRAAGEAAMRYVEDGMRVGLGTGSTARWFIEALARAVGEGLTVTGVPTSAASAALAAAGGIPLTELDGGGLDLAVDGADLVDPDLRLVKGGGGAHVREKVVAAAARRFVVIADETKLTERLRGPLPLEVLEFGAAATLAAVADICGAEVMWRRDAAGAISRTDNGNLLADALSGDIADAEGLGADLDAVPGLVGHGLFLGMADLVIVGRADSTCREIRARG